MSAAMTGKNPFAAPNAVFVMGPTASGKSEFAFRLAKRFGGEIVSADSMQIYRGMDIGTAKEPPSRREAVPHSLIDVVAPDDCPYLSAARGFTSRACSIRSVSAAR